MNERGRNATQQSTTGKEGYINNNTTINQEDEVAVVYLYLLVLIVIE